jgi:hypothetical protein
MSLEQLFDKYITEYKKFYFVKNKLSLNPDICALMLLNKLTDDRASNISIDSIKNDFIYFAGIDESKLLEVVTEQDIIDLCRCGVFYSDIEKCLAMRTDTYIVCSHISYFRKGE